MRVRFGCLGWLPLLALLAVAGCDNRTGPGDAGWWDAGGDGGEAADDAGDDAGDSGPADAGGDEEPPPWRVGSEQTLELATWNIRNFPADGQTAERVADLIAGMQVDLVAVQEIADVYAFGQVLQRLPDYTAVLSEHEYGDGEYQKTGLVYRSDLVQVRETRSLFADDGYAFPRPPLEAEVYLHRPDGSVQTLRLIVVHLKARLGEDNEARRRDACQKLAAYVDDLVQSGGETEVAVVGDFNDSLDDPPQDNVFTVFQQHPDQYRFLTDPLADANDYSYIPARVLIDHLLVSDGLFDTFAGGQVEAVALDRLVVDYDYLSRVSDHRPIVVITPW